MQITDIPQLNRSLDGACGIREERLHLTWIPQASSRLQKHCRIFLQFLILLVLLSSQLTFADTAIIRLATTTSTDNSGLLKKLLPTFEAENNYKIHVIAVGTGKALRLLRDGDVDVVLVHARAAEDKLIADGYGVNRKDVMYNDFVIIGTEQDPANIKGMSDAVAAFAKIMQNRSTFVSRGDDSGTYKKEMILWSQTGAKPSGKWYRQAGQGMGKVLLMAGELQAYTLSDRGTWLSYQAKSPLKLLVEGDSRLFNPYGIIAINPKKYPDANYTGAMRLIEWITSVPAQETIQNYTVNGKALFNPMASNNSATATR